MCLLTEAYYFHIFTPGQKCQGVEKNYLKTSMDAQNLKSFSLVLFQKYMGRSFSVKSLLVFGDHLWWLKNI